MSAFLDLYNLNNAILKGQVRFLLPNYMYMYTVSNGILCYPTLIA